MRSIKKVIGNYAIGEKLLLMSYTKVKMRKNNYQRCLKYNMKVRKLLADDDKDFMRLK